MQDAAVIARPSRTVGALSAVVTLAGLLMAWYRAHRSGGGALDPVAEDLIAEAAAEDAAGQPYSHAPGRA